MISLKPHIHICRAPASKLAEGAREAPFLASSLAPAQCLDGIYVLMCPDGRLAPPVAVFGQISAAGFGRRPISDRRMTLVPFSDMPLLLDAAHRSSQTASCVAATSRLMCSSQYPDIQK